MNRRLLALGLLLALGACDSSQAPTSSVDDLVPRSALYQGDNGLGGEAYFKPPIGPGNGLPAGLNPNLLVSFVICDYSDVVSEMECGGVPAKVIPTSEITVDLVDEWYLAEWDTDDRSGAVGPEFRIFVVLPLVGTVAYADVALGSSGADLKAIRDGVEEVVALKDGRTLPIGVRLLGFNDEPSSRAADCVDGIIGTGIIDCDVETVPPGGTPPNPLVVFDDPNAENFGVGQLDPAGSIGYDPDCFAQNGPVPLCERAYTIVFEHIPDNPAANANQPIPDGNAYGFFVRVDAFQETGDPVVFSPGWTLDLCQDAQTEADLGPSGLIFLLEVFQVRNNGDVEFPPSTNGTGGFCDAAGNNGGALIRPDNGSVLSRLTRKLRSLAALVTPRPLLASLATVSHGGKRTTGLDDFSGFGTTIVQNTDPGTVNITQSGLPTAGNTVTLPMDPLVGASSVASFYSYGTPNNASANTPAGITPESDVSLLFLYQQDLGEGVSTTLVIIHDQPVALGDFGGGQARFTFNPTTGLDFVLEDGEGGDDFDLSDGKAFWTWLTCCTDGGALTLPVGSSFTITPEWIFANDGTITTWKLVSFPDGTVGSRENVLLDLTTPVTIQIN